MYNDRNSSRSSAEPASSGPARPSAQPEDAPPADGAADPVRLLTESLQSLRDGVRFLVELRLDQLRMAVRDRIEKLGATMAVAILLLAVMIAAAVFVMYGAALAVASYSGDRLWLGYLLTGLFFMLAITAILFTGRRRARAQARRILEQKYARYDRNSQTDAGERTDTPA